MNYSKLKHLVYAPGLAVMLCAASLQSCSDDTLTGQPSWLGNSIYEELEHDGNYKTTLRLIDDLGLHDVLSQTGSKTLFVADDDAYNQWFSNNDWGVRNYDQLTNAQKKLLFNGSMINNAYLIELLSNVSGNPPENGQCMRRATAVSIYDSVTVMKPSEMPSTPAWAKYKNAGKNIRIFKDATTPPMIHFLPAYMQYNKITDEDLSILTNGEATSASEAWVNGKKIIDRDITCKNGYIQKVDGVVESSPNMAEILRQHPVMSGWSHLIDRFSAPYYYDAGTKEFDRLYNSNDSVYTLRYYSEYSNGGPLNTDPDGNKVSATLSFDPGWNQYMYTNTMGRDMHYDAGAMIVPTNDALNAWWNDGAGKVLKDVYHTWDNVPDLVLSKLLNVNMLGVFSETVPSKFGAIMNDAKIELGITKDNVDSCFMGCNGVIYLSNKVFTPSAYASVSFPALIHQDIMSVIYWAIDNLEFTPYLNSMDSYYSLILPSNNAMLWYVDPCYFGENRQTLLEFYYDDEEKTVKADRYYCTIENGQITKGDVFLRDVPRSVVENRLRDLMNQIIIVDDIEGGYTYYKSKGGSLIKVNNGGKVGSMTIAGGWQNENGVSMPVTNIYDESAGGNGKSYLIDQQMPIGSAKSVYQTLQSKEEYNEFFNLITGGDPDDPNDNMMINRLSKKYDCVDKNNNFNMRLFDTYNYTVYVPTNESIKELINKGYLPTWDDFDAEREIAQDESKSAETRALADTACKVIKDRINDFIRYHIQDNSVIIGGAPDKDVNGNNLITNNYETMMINPANGRFFPLTVTNQGDNLTIKDYLGNTASVIKTEGLYNNICREYWFSGTGSARTIYTASDAVVHLIDKPLYYSKTELSDWKNEAKKRFNRRR